jgi:hypothetical protein
VLVVIIVLASFSATKEGDLRLFLHPITKHIGANNAYAFAPPSLLA